MKLSSPISKCRGTLEVYDENIVDSEPLIPASEFKLEEAQKLQAELCETKEKLRVMTQKFASVRKERDSLKKETKELQNEIMTLQISMREMVPGFSNTGSIFPMYNELQVMLSDFMKCTCEDIFFDYLSPELSMEGVVYFFKESLYNVHTIVTSYFAPVYEDLCKAMCIEKMEGPFNNILKKSFQNNWKVILSSCVTPEKCKEIALKLQGKLHLRDDSAVATKAITEFLRSLSEIYFLCYISEPAFVFSLDSIGTKAQFNAIKHETIDGFVKNKEPCIIILPTAHKNSAGGELIGKAHVLAANYEFA